MKSIIQVSYTIYPQNSGQTIYSLALARWLASKYNIYLFTYANKPFTKETDEILNFYKEIHTYKYHEKRDAPPHNFRSCVEEIQKEDKTQRNEDRKPAGYRNKEEQNKQGCYSSCIQLSMEQEQESKRA